jgi:hypothetical protein
MRKAGLLMMRCIVVGGLLTLPIAAPSLAGDVTVVSGRVSYVSKDVVEVDGRRGLINAATSIVSDGHPVSLDSVHVGMFADMEIDPSGDALQVEVKGAVE